MTNHRAVRSLAQNFLIDARVADRIVEEYGNVNSKDIVIEIGPGRGILTKKLAERAKKVIGIEIDRRLIEYLRHQKIPNLELICGDALKIDFPKFDKIISNLPYKISSPLTFKILTYYNNNKFLKAVLMYQKEFAERLVAQPYSKEYSRLTVAVYYRAKCEILELVPRTAFYPRPKVDSAIVLLIPHKKKPFEVINENIFFNLVNAGFSQRRKQLRTVLLNNWELFSTSRDRIKALSNKLDNVNRRIEELAPDEIAELSNQIANFINKLS